MLYHPVAPRLSTFTPRLQEGVCLGHTGGGMYKVLTAEKVVRTKHVRAVENEFPGTRRIRLNESDSGADLSDSSDSTSTVYGPSSNDSDSDDESDNEPMGTVQDLVTYVPQDPSNFGETESEGDETGGHVTKEQDDDDDSDSGGDDENDFVDAHDGDDNDEAVDQPVSSRTRRQPRVQYSAAALPSTITTDDEPKLRVALKSPERKRWLKAIREEFKTLVALGTWVKVDDVPPGAKVIPTGIILKLKRDQDGLPSRFKARTVARGNCQSDDFDVYELYAPVACIEAVRILLAIAAAKGWRVDHLDIKGAFLYAPLPKSVEVYIRLPKVPGVPEATGDIVKLRMSLYGLRQAPKLWYELLAKRLKGIGFRRSIVNDAVFISTRRGPPVYLLVYVDDILVVGDGAAIQDVKERLSSLFTVTDLGACTHFLGIKIERSAKGMFLSQKPFAEKIVELAGMTNAKPAKYPLPLSHPLYDEKTTPSEENLTAMQGIPFREVLGSLLFLATRTRPDLATAVSMLGKFQQEPLVKHWKAMKSVVRYLIGTTDSGLFFPFGQEATIEAWSDADWARDHHKRRSRSGYLVTVARCPVVWASRLQTLTAQSTTEAEFISLAHCVRELHWIRATVSELKAEQSNPTVVHQDNLGTISWTTEIQVIRKVKHIGIRYHYVRDAVDEKAIEVEYVPSSENKADGLTKVLVTSAFDSFTSAMSIFTHTGAATH